MSGTTLSPGDAKMSLEHSPAGGTLAQASMNQVHLSALLTVRPRDSHVVGVGLLVLLQSEGWGVPIR